MLLSSLFSPNSTSLSAFFSAPIFFSICQSLPSPYLPFLLASLTLTFFSTVRLPFSASLCLTGSALRDFHDGLSLVISGGQLWTRIWSHRQQKNNQGNVFLFHRKMEQTVAVRVANVRLNPWSKKEHRTNHCWWWNLNRYPPLPPPFLRLLWFPYMPFILFMLRKKKKCLLAFAMLSVTDFVCHAFLFIFRKKMFFLRR